MEIDTTTRGGRMLAAMLETEQRAAKVRVTVSLFNGDERRLHQTIRLRTWNGRDGLMLTADLDDGSWAEGRYATKVLNVNPATGKVFPAQGMSDELLIYAAKCALGYLTTGKTACPANGRVEVVETNNCSCCGRKLTHPDSIALGIGPECQGKLGRSGQTIVSFVKQHGEAVAA